MAYSNSGSKLDQYRQCGSKVEVMDASPHRLVQMLMEGALEKISIAKGHMVNGSVAEKGRHISWAISIIEGLRSSIDSNAGGEIANNLESLYEYMGRRLLQANIENDPEILDEVGGLLREIKGAWDAIPEEVKGLRAKVEPSPAGDNLLRAGA